LDNNSPRRPILVGISAVQQKNNAIEDLLEPWQLMAEAARRAAADANSDKLLKAVDYILVPEGTWSYSDPGTLIKEAVGATRAHTVLAKVGIPQQTLLSRACNDIAHGKAEAVLVTGGEAQYRALLAAKSGIELADTTQTDIEPDEILHPDGELVSQHELSRGLIMPVGLYAIMENALRHHLSQDIESHRDEISAMYERFSRIASQNPSAWSTEPMTAGDIRNPSPTNRMLAFPYTKSHSSQWNVDQAAALLFCSVGKARELGIPENNWIYALCASESNHMTVLSERRALYRCIGAAAAAKQALFLAGKTPEQIEHLEMYSCFPVAVRLYALEIGFPLSRQLTVSGGMSFAGGPFNNFVFQSLVRLCEVLRKDPGSTGLLSCVSGIVTKQGISLWSTESSLPEFRFSDVTDQVKSATEVCEVVPHYEGRANIAGYTVLYGKEEPERGIAVCDIPDGKRHVAYTLNQALMAQMTCEEFCGKTVIIRADGTFEIPA